MSYNLTDKVKQAVANLEMTPNQKENTEAVRKMADSNLSDKVKQAVVNLEMTPNQKENTEAVRNLIMEENKV